MIVYLNSRCSLIKQAGLGSKGMVSRGSLSQHQSKIRFVIGGVFTEFSREFSLQDRQHRSSGKQVPENSSIMYPPVGCSQSVKLNGSSATEIPSVCKLLGV